MSGFFLLFTSHDVLENVQTNVHICLYKINLVTGKLGHFVHLLSTDFFTFLSVFFLDSLEHLFLGMMFLQLIRFDIELK